MSEFNIDEHKKWYEDRRPVYELLSNTVKNTLESLIKNAGIEYLSITFRAKEAESFAEKIGRKSYQDPAKEITDLAGIRVITFIESDALKVNELIKASFSVDDSRSLDKSDELGIDKFGYRSFHFVCGLGEPRCSLPENNIFKDLVCEIQVRTVLQHAWAEIEHDRNYKFAGELPGPIKRRLHLLAGLLEIADGEFNKLSHDIDNYSNAIARKAKSGDLDIELNSISLLQYLQGLKRRINFDIELISSPGAIKKVIAELCLFNINTIEGVDELFTTEFLDKVSKFKHTKYFALPYLITDAIIYTDLERYFQFVHTRNNLAIDKESYDMLVKKFGVDRVNQLFEDNKVSVIDWDSRRFIVGNLKGIKLAGASKDKRQNTGRKKKMAN